MLLLMTQHRMIGATLAVSALAALLAAAPGTAEEERRSPAFPLLLLVLGAQLLFYTEGSQLVGGAGP
jgi:heme A synthase